MPRYFIYCRKSSEAEDRQVLSIESQINELKKLAVNLKLPVLEVLTESQSAKSPGRPIFNKMIKEINEGRATGIICWKLDRLARNPIDGGQITWFLQQGTIKHLQTSDRSYYPEDNVLLMNVEFGMANQFILDLSKNVKRGLKTKVEKGWLPGHAPLGYLNDRRNDKGKREISKDPERFDLVKKMWLLMKTGRFTPAKIIKIATDFWGLRTKKERPLSRSKIYELFTNPFYYGWFEYPRGSSHWYQGSHEPMITQEEFDQVQILLGKRGKPRLKKLTFSFTGLIRCGECGAMVTAELKNQIICSECKNKFSANNRSVCPQCQTLITEMKQPKILRYVYYHCTKRKDPNCSQKSIGENVLEGQINHYLSQIHISEAFKNWAIKYLKEENDKEARSREKVFATQRRAYDNCIKRIENLFQLKISPLNINGDLLSDEEYAKQKSELIKEKARLEEILNDAEYRVEKWLEVGEQIFDFACYAKYWFKNGTVEQKGVILNALGSNLSLKDKKLFIELKKPFRDIGEVAEMVPQASGAFEPANLGLTEQNLEETFATSPVVYRLRDKVRTWIMTESTAQSFYIPSFKEKFSAAA